MILRGLMMWGFWGLKKYYSTSKQNKFADTFGVKILDFSDDGMVE